VSEIKGYYFMHNKFKPSILTIVLICFFVLCGMLGSTLANESSKSIDLNINLDLKFPADRSKDNFMEKYDEVINEIAISEEANEVVDQIRDVFLEVKDAKMDVLITEIKGQRNEEVHLELLVGVEQKLARLEFKAPSALRGNIMVLNQEKMETKMFQPVVNKIRVQALEDVSKEALSALNVAQITSYFDFSQYEVDILEEVKVDNVHDYLLRVYASDGQTWLVRVKNDSWVPYEIAVYEKEVAMGIVNFHNVVLNPELSVEELQRLPKVKEERI